MTYTLLSEPGASLIAAGWRPVAITDGGSWDRPSRPRLDLHLTDRKIRWECRHSELPAIPLDPEGGDRSALRSPDQGGETR